MTIKSLTPAQHLAKLQSELAVAKTTYDSISLHPDHIYCPTCLTSVTNTLVGQPTTCHHQPAITGRQAKDQAAADLKLIRSELPAAEAAVAKDQPQPVKSTRPVRSPKTAAADPVPAPAPEAPKAEPTEETDDLPEPYFIVFSHSTKVFSSGRIARKWLRNHGLSIRTAERKPGNYFHFNLPEPTASVK